ncbi:excinuclease ABC subunit C [Granulicella tundricola]|uniref:excinuclease ABC subunit C n=1 Tax=Granulicella tundricola TaxID=940615 RepID=UPI0002EEBF1A|nr:excinuclease ABC subunit C [Granulicella tundricola]
MSSAFQFAHHLPFTPTQATEILRQIPTLPGVFALRGERDTDEPYLTRAADLRRRMTRLLAPPESQSRRLNLSQKVTTIAWCVTGSEFESTLVLYDALAAQFGHPEARRRMKLHTPTFLRFTAEHAHPRVYSTNKLSRRSLDNTYGPFQSRTAAERYCDAVLDLFKLRRCHEDLEVSPSHPGCAYGEMKKCMAPCNQTCTADEYAAESAAVKAFFDTHGDSMLAAISADRERASSDMEFEQAAALHTQYTKVKATAALADELVRPIPHLRAVIVQKSSDTAEDPNQAALFMLEAGCLSGPERLSTLGVRAVKEQTSVGSSLFAQPLMLQAVPLEPEAAATPTDSPELRAEQVLQTLTDKFIQAGPPDPARLSDHLSLLRRWYYRPEKQRQGEVFLPNPDGSWPIRRILRGAARMALGDPRPIAETNREAAPEAAEAIKTKLLHEGREGIERAVPVIAGRARRKKSVVPADVLSD